MWKEKKTDKYLWEIQISETGTFFGPICDASWALANLHDCFSENEGTIKPEIFACIYISTNEPQTKSF